MKLTQTSSSLSELPIELEADKRRQRHWQPTARSNPIQSNSGWLISMAIPPLWVSAAAAAFVSWLVMIFSAVVRPRKAAAAATTFRPAAKPLSGARAHTLGPQQLARARQPEELVASVVSFHWRAKTTRGWAGTLLILAMHNSIAYANQHARELGQF